MNLIEFGCEDIVWSHLVQNSIQWQTLANTVLNLQVSWHAEQLSDFKQGFCSVEFLTLCIHIATHVPSFISSHKKDIPVKVFSCYAFRLPLMFHLLYHHTLKMYLLRFFKLS